MKIRFLKLKDWLLMTVMGVFGLTACHSTKEAAQEQVVPEPDDAVVEPQPRGEIALMYGVPTMDFVLKGRVIDAKGNPVKGMQVILVNQTVDIAPDHMDEDNPYVQEYIQKASDTTDVQGTFECRVKDVPVERQRVIIRDIDGDKNGRYEDQMVEVEFTEENQTGERKGWYMGTRTKDVDITVSKK
ncbi:MAG: radical SAM-associated putative lipoprotein [Bacteroidales bacterium]|nr:radical SAM-associated putative lipoprotein [Bacteroidales bacterium]